MGLGKLVDALLFIYYLFTAVVSLLFDSQVCLPSHLYPNLLIEAKSHYARQYGDYLVQDKPHFFVGLVALELFVQWPLLIANMYAIVTKKSWFNVTCLIQGVCSFTSMVAIFSDIMGTQKESDTLLMIYGPFMGFSILAVLRGLVPASRRGSSTHVARSSVSRKKRA